MLSTVAVAVAVAVAGLLAEGRTGGWCGHGLIPPFEGVSFEG